jgi:energy-coupling factor transporter ATP-binding protein EcfA2
MMQAPPSSRDAELGAGNEAPRVEWPALHRYLAAQFQQGDHVAVLGPTGTGKTHLALEVAELRKYVMIVACKPADPLIDDAVAKGYYLVPGNRLEVPYSDGVPLHRHVIYWPRLVEPKGKHLEHHRLLGAERAMQKPLVGGALGYVRRRGHWCLVLDEGTYVTRDLGLQRDVDSALTQFRTLNASVVVLGQRPAWMGRYVLSMPTHLFLFKTANSDDLKSLGDISGTDTKLVQALVRGLDGQSHEFLYINTRAQEMFRSTAPARQ